MPELQDESEEFEAQMRAAATMKHMLGQGTASDPSQPSQLRQYAMEIVRSAAKSYTKRHGKLPGYMGELVSKFIAPPTVPWNELYAAYVQRVLMSKPVRGMRRISKRRAAVRRQLEQMGRKDLAKRLPLFPGYERDSTFYIVYVVDTSGSMGVKELQLGLSELQHLMRSGYDVRVLVLYIDTSIGKEYEVGPDDEIDPLMVGRGGTEFETAFAYVKSLMDGGRHVDLVVYATDGYADPPRTKLPVPTAWLITPNGTPIMKGVQGHITFQMRDYEAGAQPDA